MLEFLMLAIFSQSSQDFMSSRSFNELPQIEVLEPLAIPQRNPQKIAPKLLENPDTAILAMDLDSGKVLLDKETDRPQPIASLSKLMTALIIMENHELDEIITVPYEATIVGNSSTIDVYEYEQFTVETLMGAILIPSANDAAITLAVSHSGSEAEFVREMNRRAKELGLMSAEFFNSTGLDMFNNEGTKTWGNKMSARDVMKLTRLLRAYDFVRETMSKDHFYGTSVDGKFFHEKSSTNQLLNTFVNVTGGKTGFTYLAGECFTAIGKTPDGHEILTVILGSSDRFGETKKLLSWIYDSFEWR